MCNYCSSSGCNACGNSCGNNNYVTVPVTYCDNGVRKTSYVSIPIDVLNGSVNSGCGGCGNTCNSCRSRCNNSCGNNSCGTIDVYYARQYALSTCGCGNY